MYLYIALSLVALLPFLFLHRMTQAEALQIAHYTALPFLAWVVLSAYYLVRWVVRKRPQHQNSINTIEKRT